MASSQSACVARSRYLCTDSSLRSGSHSPSGEKKLSCKPVLPSAQSNCAIGTPNTVNSSQQCRSAYLRKTLGSCVVFKAATRKCWSSLQCQDRDGAGPSSLLQHKAFLKGRSFGYKGYLKELKSSASGVSLHPLRHKSAVTVRCEAATKIANLTASRSMTAPLPIHTDSEGRQRTLSEFLKLPVGRESMLKGQSCKKRELIDENTFRCYLRSIEAFKFAVSPVIDVRVTSTDDTCTVEMLQCRFLGSEAVERQNNRFSASFRNYIDWRENGSPQQELQNEIKLDLALEVFTPPFTMLPLGAIERPGSAFLQALLDRVAPAFVESLLADYEAWAKGELSETDSFAENNHVQRTQAESEIDELSS